MHACMHYSSLPLQGGKPGYYPPFSGFFNDQYWPHPLPLNLCAATLVWAARTLPPPPATSRHLLISSRSLPLYAPT